MLLLSRGDISAGGHHFAPWKTKNSCQDAWSPGSSRCQDGEGKYGLLPHPPLHALSRGDVGPQEAVHTAPAEFAGLRCPCSSPQPPSLQSRELFMPPGLCCPSLAPVMKGSLPEALAERLQCVSAELGPRRARVRVTKDHTHVTACNPDCRFL